MAITAIVRFALPEGKTRESATAAFEASAPLYRGVPGPDPEILSVVRGRPDRRRRVSLQLARGCRAPI